MLIRTDNDGQAILASTYWDSDIARAGKIYVSVNAGAIRVMLPWRAELWLSDMRLARECVLSRGPWNQAVTPDNLFGEAVEIMWDDGSSEPFALHLTPESFDMLPAPPEPGRKWVCSVWIDRHAKPHKEVDLLCHWRRVPRIPWLKPWRENGA